MAERGDQSWIAKVIIKAFDLEAGSPAGRVNWGGVLVMSALCAITIIGGGLAWIGATVIALVGRAQVNGLLVDPVQLIIMWVLVFSVCTTMIYRIQKRREAEEEQEPDPFF